MGNKIKNKYDAKSKKQIKYLTIALALGVLAEVALNYATKLEIASISNKNIEMDNETYLLDTIESYLAQAQKGELNKAELKERILVTIESYKSQNVYPNYISEMFATIEARLELDIENGKTMDEIVGRIKTCLDKAYLIKEGISSYEPEEAKHR